MTKIAFDPATDCLALIDVQPTFMPGGALAVPDGDAVVPVCNRLLAAAPLAIATQDWHPPGHVSFASSWPGKRALIDTIELSYGTQALWPDHGIQGTAEAALHPALDQTRIAAVIRKGMNPQVDSYSAFFENDRTTPTGLHGWLQARGVKRLFLAGLATDFCVGWSAEDALRLGYQVVIVKDACRGIGIPQADGRSSIDHMLDGLAAKGAILTDSAALLAGHTPAPGHRH